MHTLFVLLPTKAFNLNLPPFMFETYEVRRFDKTTIVISSLLEYKSVKIVSVDILFLLLSSKYLNGDGVSLQDINS